MKQWEYYVLGMDNGFVDVAKLNKIGKEGWELIGIVLAENGLQSIFYFKRELIAQAS